MQDRIDVQGEFFLKIQYTCRGDFFSKKIHKGAGFWVQITKIVIIVWKRTEIKAARLLLTLKYSNYYNFVALFRLQKRYNNEKY